MENWRKAMTSVFKKMDRQKWIVCILLGVLLLVIAIPVDTKEKRLSGAEQKQEPQLENETYVRQLEHERIAAGPGSKTYGILSILIQAWYKVEYLFTVHEHVFNPPPKVKSAVIRMTRNETKELGCNERLFKLIVKTTFNQRRKTLRNSISSILEKGNPLSNDPVFNKRPEQLSVQEFIELTNRVETALKDKADIDCGNDIARKGATSQKE